MNKTGVAREPRVGLQFMLGCCDQLHVLSWQLDSPESDTHLSSAEGGLHADSKEPTSWQALSSVHQSHP